MIPVQLDLLSQYLLNDPKLLASASLSRLSHYRLTDEFLAQLESAEDLFSDEYGFLPSAQALFSQLLTEDKSLKVEFLIFTHEDETTYCYVVCKSCQVLPIYMPTTPALKKMWANLENVQSFSVAKNGGLSFSDRESLFASIFQHLTKQTLRANSKRPEMTILGKLFMRSPYNLDYQLEDEEFVDMYRYRYATDGRFVYLLQDGWPERKYPKSDPKTFEILSHVYAKDKNNVYVYGARKTKIDASSFRVVCDDPQYFVCVGADKNNLYEFDCIFKNIDPENFIVLNKYYGKNKTQVVNLYSRRVIKHADPETFEVTDDIGGARDQYRTYWLALSPRWSGGTWEEDLEKDPYGCFRAGQTSIKHRKTTAN